MTEGSATRGTRYQYIPSIDGLRALAVLAVMLYHLDPRLLPGGFTGVDLFFVISGYVVSASLARDQARNFVGFTLGFYARRILRIFPALIVCLLVVTLASVALVPESWLSDTSDKTGLFAFFGISNFALVLFNDGYFSPRVDFNPFTHTWSLAVEEQFYLIVPPILFVWLHFRGRKGVLGVAATGMLAALLLSSLIYAWWETPRRPDWAFYLLPSRFWELAAGAMLFKFQHRHGLIPAGQLQRGLLLGVGMGLIALGFGWSDKTAFPFPWALSPVMGAMLLIAAVVATDGPKPWLQRMLEAPVATRIGKISYSLYLWHWPVYVLMRWTMGLEYWWHFLIALTLTALFAEASYRLVEIPLRRNPWSRRHVSWKTVGIGLATILLSFSVATALLDSRKQLSLSVTRDKQVWYPEPWPSVDLHARQDFEGRQLFAIGDSHAGAYATLLQRLADEHGVTVVYYFSGACPVASLIRGLEAAGPACVARVERYLAEIDARARPGDIVFLASLRMERFADQFAIFPLKLVIAFRDSVESASERQQALDETIALIERLRHRGLEVVIDAPKPVFRAPIFRCSDPFNRDNPICTHGATIDRAMLVEHRSAVMRSLKQLSSQFSGLHVWDPFPILCPGDTCSAFDEGAPLFFDADHLSAHGNRVLYPSFESLVTKIWSRETAVQGLAGND